MASSAITAHLDEAAAARLDQLAERIGRSPNIIAATAITRFVEDELELIASLDRAEAEIDRGEFYTQEQVEAWFAVRRAGGAAD